MAPTRTRFFRAFGLSVAALLAASCSAHHDPSTHPVSGTATTTPTSAPSASPSEQNLTDGTVIPEASGLVTFAAGKAWIPRGKSLLSVDPADGRTLASVPLGDYGRFTFPLGHTVCVALTARTACVDTSTGKIARRYSRPIEAAGLGSLWAFTADGLNLLRVDPSRGVVTGTVRVENSMDWAPLVATCDGAVWVSSGTERAVSRIDPSSMRVTARIGGFGHVDSLLVDACGYGKLWVQQNANGGGVLYRVDPATATITGHTALGRAVDSGDYGGSDIAIADGAIWTGDSSPTVSRVDPSTLKVQEYKPKFAPEWVAVGFGSIWTSTEDDNGRGTTTRLSE
jgi:hypothetical protein